MKTAYISVITALLGISAATAEKRRPGVQCVADGEPVSDPSSCQTIIDEYSGKADEDVNIPNSGFSLGCTSECHAVYSLKDEKPITLKGSDIAGDLQNILNQCGGDGPMAATFSEESGDKARRLEVTKNTSSIC